MAPKPLKHFNPQLISPFWAKISKGKPDECWLWTAGRQRNYGTFNGLRTHRIAYFLTHGIVPDGLSVLHRCDNPPCCNPNHLFLGTQADNMHDKRDKGRSVRQSRLTQSDVLKIVKEWGAGHKRRWQAKRRIAKKYGVTTQCIHNIVNGIRWSFLTSIKAQGGAK